eukprot:1845624-Amphidinium_carterae.1
MVLNVVTSVNCVYYHNHVRRLFRTFGPGTCLKICHARVMCVHGKSTWTESDADCSRSSRRGGALAGFRLEAPWNAVRRATVEDEKFWNRQFWDAASPAPRTMPVSGYIEGDATIEVKQGQRGLALPSLPSPSLQRSGVCCRKVLMT